MIGARSSGGGAACVARQAESCVPARATRHSSVSGPRKANPGALRPNTQQRPRSVARCQLLDSPPRFRPPHSLHPRPRASRFARRLPPRPRARFALSRPQTPPSRLPNMAPSSTPAFSLPALPTLEPLTSGTDLPDPGPLPPPSPASPASPPAGAAPPRSAVSPVPSFSTPRPAIPHLSPTPSTDSFTNGFRRPDRRPSPVPSPPQSPGKSASMRRFLSRVSMNSEADKASIASSTGVWTSLNTTTSPPEKKQKYGKLGGGGSWWKKNRRHSAAITFSSPAKENVKPSTPMTSEHRLGTASTRGEDEEERHDHLIPPPPRLPDDMFGKNLSSLDTDMFKNFGSTK